ncbi:MAG: hypothetical protein AAGG01_07330 [Planctomycetota bacterium]
MPRRKVTMLEAFQRSAAESAERAAADRRRVIAEREREIRRAEAAKAAQELGSRISQRATGVGSLIAGMRGASAEEDGAEPATNLADGAGDAVAASEVDLTDIGVTVGPPEPAAGSESSESSSEAKPIPERRRGPALPAFDRAHEADLTAVAPEASSLEALGSAGPASTARGADSAAASEASSPERSPRGPGVLPEDAEADEVGADEGPFAHSTQEDVEHAIRALEDETFELPMSPRMFLGLSALVAAAVFFIGLSIGRESAGSTAGSTAGPARAGLPAQLAAQLAAPGERYGEASPAPRSTTHTPAPSGPSGDAAAPAVLAGAGQAPAPDAPAPHSPEGTSPLTYADRAFQDPENKFSILAITYTRTEAHAQMALETYDLLNQERFPAIHPIQRGSRIYVFVGAAKTMGELEGLRDDLRELENSRSGRREFRSAYLVNIAPYR